MNKIANEPSIGHKFVQVGQLLSIGENTGLPRTSKLAMNDRKRVEKWYETSYTKVGPDSKPFANELQNKRKIGHTKIP